MTEHNKKSGARLDVAKLVFYTLTICFAVGLSFGIGLYSGVQQNALFLAVASVRTAVLGAVSTIWGEASTLTGTRPSHFLRPARDERRGVTVNHPQSDQTELILVTGFFDDSNELRLMQRDGTPVSRWPIEYYSLFPDASFIRGATPPATNWNIDTHGVLALEDGSIVFTFEMGGAAKLDSCGELVWTVPRRTHHAIDYAEGGGFWVAERRYVEEGPSTYPPYLPPYNEDFVIRVSDDGGVEAEFSAVRLFYDNGLEALLTSGQDFRRTKGWDLELIHLNSIDELTSDLANDFPMFEAGDLLLSIRGKNLIIVTDSTGSTVKWWQIGPWLRQHSPEFRRGGKIVVFNNNAYRPAFDDDPNTLVPGWGRLASNLIEIDPATDELRVIYGGREDQPLFTTLRGKLHSTPAGGFILTEYEGGRILEIAATGDLVWEFVNRYDEDAVATVTDARVYPASYFEDVDWACHANQ